MFLHMFQAKGITADMILAVDETSKDKRSIRRLGADPRNIAHAPRRRRNRDAFLARQDLRVRGAGIAAHRVQRVAPRRHESIGPDLVRHQRLCGVGIHRGDVQRVELHRRSGERRGALPTVPAPRAPRPVRLAERSNTPRRSLNTWACTRGLAPS